MKMGIELMLVRMFFVHLKHNACWDHANQLIQLVFPILIVVLVKFVSKPNVESLFSQHVLPLLVSQMSIVNSANV